MRLQHLAETLTGLRACHSDADLTGVAIDSRSAKPGDLFVAMPGARYDGHYFVEDALKRGASAALVSQPEIFHELRQQDRPCALVIDATDACWRASKQIYGDPSAKLVVIGVTGTNGKTTVAWLLSQVLTQFGCKAAYMGTLGARVGDRQLSTGLTTPFSPEVNSILKGFVDDGVTHVVMEVSSHALAQRRIDGVEFDAAVFTNLSQDHLDFHPDIEDYFNAKRRLFVGLPSSKRLHSIINADDEFGRRLLKELKDSISFGESPAANLRILSSGCTASEIHFQAAWGGETVEVHAPMGARFNVMNALAAMGAGLTLGYEAAAIAEALAGVRPAPGRFESVPTGRDFDVLVDYAHTPDALEKLLESVRELKPKRILTVFGCGGDRDRTKRPLMARAASRLSDVVFVTSDNPRTEDPLQIIHDILEGMDPGKNPVVEPDRRKAIELALREAKPGDVVVIAGKGHEDYQILGTNKIHFDDREVAADVIGRMRA